MKVNIKVFRKPGTIIALSLIIALVSGVALERLDSGVSISELNEDETLLWNHHSPPTTIIEQGSGVETADFIIFHDDETPKNYYAKSGDNGEIVFGGADADAVINSALSALPAAGGMVFLTRGTYVVDGAITIPKSRVALVGTGAATIIKIKDYHDTDIKVIYANFKYDVLIANLKVDGNKANQTAGTMDGIYFDTVVDSKITRCWVEDMYTWGSGIYLGASDYNIVTGNNLEGNSYDGIYLTSGSDYNTITGNTCQGNDYDGIYIDSSDYNTITGNTCQGNGGSGIYLEESSHNTITGNTCQGNDGSGIYLLAGNNNAITGNTCQGNTDGIYSEDSIHNAITGNTCQGNTDDGIESYDGHYSTITGNTCQGNGGNGIYVSADHNTVEGNTVEGNSQTAHNTCDGILVDTGGGYNNIQGNTVRQGVGAKKQRYGIRIEGTGNFVIGNDLHSAGATGNFSDAGVGTVVRSNRGWETTITCHQFIPSCEFGKPATDPPAVAIYGICQALEFSVDTDKAYYKLLVPCNWKPGTDILFHVHWTRSTTGSDDSTKTVKWQLKNLLINGTSEDCSTGEATDSIEDAYDSSSTTDQIVYMTGDMTVAAAEIDTVDDIIILELMAVTPIGTELTDPAAVGLGITYTGYQVTPA